MRKYASKEFFWKDDNLFLMGRKTPILKIEPDKTYPEMWRLRLADGTLTDMVNRMRAKDVGVGVALLILNTQGSGAAPPLVA